MGIPRLSIDVYVTRDHHLSSFSLLLGSPGDQQYWNVHREGMEAIFWELRADVFRMSRAAAGQVAVVSLLLPGS